jgi:formamidopyrimidine-DNA glycosylase
MRNGLSKRRGRIDKNLTERLQRYVILQYERTGKYLILNINNIALQVMLSEHHFDFDFHQTNPDIHISTLSDS